MTTLLVIVWILLAFGLLLVTAMRPSRTKHSRYELERRGENGELRRERLLGGVTLLLWLTARLLIVLIATIALVLWQAWGVVEAVGLVVAVELLSRVRFSNRQAMRLYSSQEGRMITLVERVTLLRWLGRTQTEAYVDQKLESAEHLQHLIESAGHVLTPGQQKLLGRGLSWHTTEVASVMTPANKIVSVTRGELLGPLVLDDLHRTGHARFPVTHGGIDHIAGQVNIADLLEVDAGKKSPTAEKVMTPLAVRLPADTLLPAALEQLLDHPSQLGIVVDDDGKTIGLVSLRDVLEALVG